MGGIKPAEKKCILNATPFKASIGEIAGGVRDLDTPIRSQVSTLLTFTKMPTREELDTRAFRVAEIIKKVEVGLYVLHDIEVDAVLISGPAMIASALERELREVGLNVVYSYVAREAHEYINKRGFKAIETVYVHKGFIPAF